jgi:hypothetical protein
MKTHHRIVVVVITIAIASVALSSSSDQRSSVTPMSRRGSTSVVTDVAAPTPASIASWRTPIDPNPKELKITAWLILFLKEGRSAR